MADDQQSSLIGCAHNVQRYVKFEMIFFYFSAWLEESIATDRNLDSICFMVKQKPIKSASVSSVLRGPCTRVRCILDNFRTRDLESS